jgi:hypothetical protein
MVFTKMEEAAESKCLICQEAHSLFKCPYTFLNVSDLLQRDQHVFRKHKILKESRTRLKTESSWTVFKKIKDIRIKVTK